MMKWMILFFCALETCWEFLFPPLIIPWKMCIRDRSRLVKANADTAKATKDLPISKGIPNLDMKVPTPDENTLTCLLYTSRCV